jgi:hypothetical protein
MLKRCRDPKSPKYPAYGGRGITVCDEWLDFTVFLSDVGPRPGPGYTIDRIDNDGNYEPGNVRWATPVQQSNNQRRTILVGVDGQAMTIRQIADRLGISHVATYKRYRKGTLLTPSALAILRNDLARGPR